MIITVIVKEGRGELKEDGGVFTVYTSKPRINGQANADIIRQLSKHFGINEDKIKILKGLRSRRKTLFIE